MPDRVRPIRFSPVHQLECVAVRLRPFMGERDQWFQRMEARFRLEHGLLLGGSLALVGAALEAIIFARWLARGLGNLAEQRLAVVAATLVIVGLQVFFTSFLLAILGLRRGE